MNPLSARALFSSAFESGVVAGGVDGVIDEAGIGGLGTGEAGFLSLCDNGGSVVGTD